MQRKRVVLIRQFPQLAAMFYMPRLLLGDALQVKPLIHRGPIDLAQRLLDVLPKASFAIVRR